MKICINIFLFCLAILVVSGCGAGNKSTSDETALYSTWIADSINGIKTDAAVYKSEFPSLVFNNQTDDISGTTGCNSINGKYTISGSSIKISNIVSTKMFCDDIDEITFLHILNNATNYKIQNGKLYLYTGKEVKMVLRKGK